MEILGAKAGAVEPQAPPFAHRLEPGWRRRAAVTGIDFQGDLGVPTYPKSTPNRIQNGLDLLNIQQGRRAAAEINCIDFVCLANFGPSRNLRNERAHVTIGSVALVHSCCKVAVGTARTAKRNVNVNSGARHFLVQLTQIPQNHSSDALVLVLTASCRLRAGVSVLLLILHCTV